MISLIPLASAWGWYPDVDAAQRVGVGIAVVLVMLIAIAMWPEKNHDREDR